MNNNNANNNNQNNMSTTENNELKAFVLTQPDFSKMTEEEKKAYQEQAEFEETACQAENFARYLKVNMLRKWDPKEKTDDGERTIGEENDREKLLREILSEVMDYEFLPGEVKIVFNEEQGCEEYVASIDSQRYGLEKLVDVARPKDMTDEEWQKERQEMIEDLKVESWEMRKLRKELEFDEGRKFKRGSIEIITDPEEIKKLEAEGKINWDWTSFAAEEDEEAAE